MARNARKKKSQYPLDKVLADQPPDRITELERRVLQLEKDVDLLKSWSRAPVFNEEVGQTVKKKKPGQQPRISDETLFSHRDGLILWLEPVWPWLAERLPVARTAEKVAAILEAIAEEPEQRPVCQQRLSHNATALLEFLFDEKCRKTELRRSTVQSALAWPRENEKCIQAANQLPTRQIANAMAGVPEIAWRTSLGRCSANPSEVRVAFNLDLYYRDKYGLPASQEPILPGTRSPVPKPYQTISTQPSDLSAKGIEQNNS
jgi:hypothetical protein